MAIGLSTTGLANIWLNVLNNTSASAVSAVWVQLHKSTGEPGSAGTANASAETTRKQITWSGAASSGTLTSSGTLSWANWSAGTETIRYVTLWTASTGGTFLWSGQLSSDRTVNNNDTLNITTIVASISPLAS